MIVVVGGGVTGLAVGWELRRAGADFVVLEAGGRAGGVIRSRRAEGRVLDAGPQRTRLTQAVRSLVDDLGLGDRMIEALPGLDLLVHARGRLRRVPTSLAGLAGSDAIGALAKARLLLEPLTGGPDASESVGAFLRRKLGREAYEHVAGPLFGGLYGSDPDDMPIDASLLPALRAAGVGRSLVLALARRGGRLRLPRAVSFVDGMAELTDALAAGLGDRLRCATPVRALARRGESWTVEVDGARFDAEAVVLTTPARVAARLLERVSPVLAPRIAALRYNPLAVVHLEGRAPVRGLGFQVALGTSPAPLLRGVTFNDCLFGAEHGRGGVYTAFLGGSRCPDVADADDDAVGRAAVDGFHRCTGGDVRVLGVERQVMPAFDRTWTGLAGFCPPEGLHFAAGWWTRPGLAGRFAEARAVATRLVGVSGRRDPRAATRRAG